MDIKDHHPHCEACTYYQPQERDIGVCHRFPPSFAGDNSAVDFHHWKFPLVTVHSWCGEFRAVARFS